MPTHVGGDTIVRSLTCCCFSYDDDDVDNISSDSEILKNINQIFYVLQLINRFPSGICSIHYKQFGLGNGSNVTPVSSHDHHHHYARFTKHLSGIDAAL